MCIGISPDSEGSCLPWLQEVSSLAASLCGLGKGSYITAASAENRPDSVQEGQHDLSDRQDGEEESNRPSPAV